MSRHYLALATLGAVCACGGGSTGADAPPPRRAVPGVETAIATTAPVRDVLRVPGAVTPDGLTSEARDAQAEVTSAEARLRLAVQQTARLRALSPTYVSPRKDLEAAIAEEASARAAALHAHQTLDALGGAAEPPPDAAAATWVVARVPQEDAPRVVAGAAVRFLPDVAGRPTYAATVDAPPSYVDPASRTAPARIRVDDPGRRLLPGMTGLVAIEVGVPHDGVVVPEAAVVYDDRGPLVFVAGGDGQFAATPVELGTIRDGRVELRTGVAAGARVATTGAASLLSALRLAPDAGD